MRRCEPGTASPRADANGSRGQAPGRQCCVEPARLLIGDLANRQDERAVGREADAGSLAFAEFRQVAGVGHRHDDVLGTVAAQEDRERSEEHTSELQSLMRISYAVFCLKKKRHTNTQTHNITNNLIQLTTT